MVHDEVVLREKLIQVWDDSDDPRWRLTIYEPLFDGKVFANLGGPALLDYVGAYAGLGPEHDVLEIGCGMGDSCEYVASHFGSRVTGMDINALQIERARDRHGDSPARLEFIQADMLQWEPSRRYDAMYFGDMLGVVQDRRTLLKKMHGWLRPGGVLALSDIVAGPDISDEDRAFIWAEDGFNSLPFEADSLALMRDAGFQELDVADITHKAVTMQDRILEESYRHKTALVDSVGADSWLAWVECAKGYRRLFAERRLLSLRIGTRRA